ncbi:MAG TPA: hypothetical protein DHU96_00195 [Actinobacteria bacterium]|nr:hypothetical protein [Actinomycetota bacterium]
MSHHDGHREAFTGGRAAASDARAARSQAGGEGRRALPGAGAGQRPGVGGLWLLLVPVACCGGPLLIAALAAAGALAWGALGLGAGVLVAVAVLVIRRRRRSSRACCEPGVTGWAQEAQTAVTRRPQAR